MKLIDNRYKIESNLQSNAYFESYKAIDLWENEKTCFITVYHYDIQSELIEYYIRKFINFTCIGHENVLKNHRFKLAKTINSKDINTMLYYTVSEYTESTTLEKISKDLNVRDKAEVLIQVILALDFLHFKGITFKFLNPSQIFVGKNNEVKLQNLSKIAEKVINSRYSNFEKDYIYSEFSITNVNEAMIADYYSLGKLIDYLFKEEESLLEEERELLMNFSDDLTRDKYGRTTFDLIDILNQIIESFMPDFTYDLTKNRDELFFISEAVGREKEISLLMNIDKDIYNKTNRYKGMLVRGATGTGKSRLLEEIAYRLEMKGRNVYSLRLDANDHDGLLDISNVLKQSIKDTPANLIEKYKDEFSAILPELALNNKIDLDSKSKKNKYRLFNRILNYFEEFSKDKIIYIIIDDIQNSDSDFFQMLNYFLENLESKNIFFVFSYKDDMVIKESATKELDNWLAESSIISEKIHNLDLEEIGEIIKNILGTAISNIDFASILFRKTQGNPREIEQLVKHFYEVGEFYMTEEGVWDLLVDDYSDTQILNSLDDVSLIQFKIIKNEYYDIFKMMSIFNDFLHKDILSTILEIDEEELNSILEELIELKLIEKKLVDWGYSYNISNLKIKKQIYFELSDDEKMLFHKEAVKSILDLGLESMDDVFEELIYHLIKSNQDDRAVRMVLEKIKEIDSIYSSRGIYLFKKAHSIAKDLSAELKLNILGSLNKIYFFSGRLKEIEPYLKEYLELSEASKDYEHLINAKSISSDILYMKSEIDMSTKELDEIYKISKENNLVSGEINVLTAKSRIYLDKGEFEEIERLLFEAIKLSEEHNIDEYLGDIYNRLGISYFMRGNINKAIIYYEKSIFNFTKAGKIGESTKPINNLANISLDHRDDIKKAMELYEKGIKIASKYGIKRLETYLLNNLGNTCLIDYKYEQGFKYISQALSQGIKLQDLYSILNSQCLVGRYYIYTNKYDKAYESYKHICEIYESGVITNQETLGTCYSFLVEFYMSLGQWDKAEKHSLKVVDLNEKSNQRAYLNHRYRLIIIQYFKGNKLNKEKITELTNEYKDTYFVQDLREMLLNTAILASIEGDKAYSVELLKKDKELINKTDNQVINETRDAIVNYLDSSDKGLEKLIEMEDSFIGTDTNSLAIILKIGIAIKLYSKKKYKASIEYLMKSLDIVYNDMLKIPDIDLRFSFIASCKTDYIKELLGKAIKSNYGETVISTMLEDVNKEKLDHYFDITPIIDSIGNKEFAEIINLNFYSDGLKINDTDELISKLTDDYKYNLELIMKYLSRKTLANKGYILEYDQEGQKYNKLLSLDNNYTDNEINENILKLSDRTQGGLLISNDMLTRGNQDCKEFLSEDIRGIICVPIGMTVANKENIEDRRKRYEVNRNGRGYIYLETDKVFNKFNEEKLKTIYELIYLVYVNLENEKLRVESTTDKLTGIYTRKHYEKLFEDLINDTRGTDTSFAVLMLDIDKFKNVNDTYGHRKGDDVLHDLGNTFKTLVRETDIIARYGGEEFIMLLKNIEAEEAIQVAEKIRKAVERMKVKGIEIPITISIGISMYPLHSQFKEELVEKADQALYYAKETGRNKTCLWQSSMDDSANRTDKLAGILTGSTEGDSRNILALIDVVDLIQSKKDIKSKAFEFLGRLLDVTDSELATLIIFDNYNEIHYTRLKLSEEWVKTPKLNRDVINRVIADQKGEFLIDWDNIDNLDPVTGIPNWDSVMVLPLIREDVLLGLVYLSTPLKVKEYGFDCYNLAKSFSNLFSAIL